MRAFKKLIFILILFSISINIFSATSLPSYEPYGENEFPEWAKKLRRAEVITLGATALTYPIMGLIVKIDDSSMSGFWTKFGISAAAGACIALADYIIGETLQKKAVEKNDPIVNLNPNSKEALSLEEMKQNLVEFSESNFTDDENGDTSFSNLNVGSETKYNFENDYKIQIDIEGIEDSLGLDLKSEEESATRLEE